MEFREWYFKQRTRSLDPDLLVPPVVFPTCTDLIKQFWGKLGGDVNQISGRKEITPTPHPHFSNTPVSSTLLVNGPLFAKSVKFPIH